MVLHLNVDRNAPYQRVAKVLDTTRDFQIARVSLMTSSPQPQGSSEPANLVSAIDIKYVGRGIVDESQIRTNIHIRIGDVVSSTALDNDVRTLYGTGLFYSVRVAKNAHPEGTGVTYIFQCNPRIVEIRFIGNSSFSDADLLKLVVSRVGGPFSERTMYSDAEAIRATYEKSGFKEPAVTYASEVNPESGEARTRFQITESR